MAMHRTTCYLGMMLCSSSVLLLMARAACCRMCAAARPQFVRCQTPGMRLGAQGRLTTLPAAVWLALFLCRCRGGLLCGARPHRCVLHAPLPPALVPLLTRLHRRHSADPAHHSGCCRQQVVPTDSRLALCCPSPGSLAVPHWHCLPRRCRRHLQPRLPLPQPLQCAVATLLSPAGITDSGFKLCLAILYVRQMHLTCAGLQAQQHIWLHTVAHHFLLVVLSSYLRATGWGIELF
jgi:hypothetical protein